MIEKATTQQKGSLGPSIEFEGQLVRRCWDENMSQRGWDPRPPVEQSRRKRTTYGDVRGAGEVNMLQSLFGFRDFIANSTSVFLTNLGLPPSDKRKYMEKIQDKALTASAWIWQSYRAIKIWQSLVVSWDTAGALWASGNDASAPKPCLNPESSSDKDFVRSNAVV